MKTQLAAGGIGVMVLVGALCAAEGQPQTASMTSSPTKGPIVAQIAGVNVTMDQIQGPLLEGYGLNVLLNVVQREIAKEGAAKAGVKVTPEDIAKEREQTIERMFKDSNEKMVDKINAARQKGQNEEAIKLTEQMRKDTAQAFDQLLQNQRLSRAEFDIVSETSAYLRKIAEPMLIGKITDENLQEAFKALYGEKVECRHIQCANLQEIQQAKERLMAGEPFAKVAQEMSRNPSTGPLGGKLPPFSLAFQTLPKEFKEAAFTLKVGQVSEIVQADGAYHLILCEGRIEPKAVKFDDVKASLREDLQDKAVQSTVKQLRAQLTEQTINSMAITDPVLKEQWRERLEKRDATIKGREATLKQMQREREQLTTQPAGLDLAPATTGPTTAP